MTVLEVRTDAVDAVAVAHRRRAEEARVDGTEVARIFGAIGVASMDGGVAAAAAQRALVWGGAVEGLSRAYDLLADQTRTAAVCYAEVEAAAAGSFGGAR